MKANRGTGNRKGKRIPGNFFIACSGTFPYTERMKNKEPISAVIIREVSTRSGTHQYDDVKNPVVEITFKGYSCNYIQVIDLKTAGELIKQLKALNIPEAE